jgi:hypothetical protein
LKLVMAVSGSGLLVGSLYAGGALSRGEVYDLPLDDARARLIEMPVPRDALLGAAGSEVPVMRVRAAAESVSWRLGSAEDAPVITARLKSEGAAKTRVVVDYAPVRSQSFVGRLMSTSFMRSFVRTSFEEQVDAELEGRPFDRQGALRAFAREAAENPDQVRELGQTVGGIFQEVGNEAAAAAHASATDSRGPKESMEAATRPSVILQPQ